MSGSDLWIYGLFALAWLLFNLISNLRRRRPLGQIDPREQAQSPTTEPQPVVLGNDWGRAPQPAPAVVREAFEPYVAAAPQPRPTAPPPTTSARRVARPRLLRSPQALREAIVLTAVLGPCRAQQPYQAPDAMR